MFAKSVLLNLSRKKIHNYNKMERESSLIRFTDQYSGMRLKHSFQLKSSARESMPIQFNEVIEIFRQN